MSENESILIGFCTGLTILGGVISMVCSYAIKSHFKQAKENEKLKDAAFKHEISSSAKDLKILLEHQAGDIKALKTEIEMTMKDVRVLSETQAHKYDNSILAMKSTLKQIQTSFDQFQKELKDTRYIIDKMRKH